MTLSAWGILKTGCCGFIAIQRHQSTGVINKRLMLCLAQQEWLSFRHFFRQRKLVWRQSLSTSSRTNYSPVFAFDPRVLLYIHVSCLPSPTDSSQIACKVGWCPKVPCPNSIVYHFVPKNCHKWDIPPFRTKPFPLFISWIPIFDLENPNFAPTSWLPPSYYEVLIKGCSNGFKTGTIWEAFRLTWWSHTDSWHWDILWDVDLPLCPSSWRKL